MPRSSDTHRIMKNALMLYIRMGFTLLVNLFLVRLVMEHQFSIFALVGLVFSAPFSAKFHIKNAPSSTLPLTLSQRFGIIVV